MSSPSSRSSTSLPLLSSLALASVVAATGLLVACSGSDSSSTAPTTTPSSTDDAGVTDPGPAVADGGGGPDVVVVIENDAAPDTGVDAAIPPGCDGTKLPSEDPCVIVEATGVFVSSSLGSDATGDGSRAKPFATLGKAVATAAPSKKRVYACPESYSESITLAEGVSLFGNLDCKNAWALDPVHVATISGKTSPTIHANNLKTKIRVEGFAIEGPTASAPGASSIAVIAANTTDLTIANGSIAAKTAASGANGTAAPVALNAANIDGVAGRSGGLCGYTTVYCDLIFAGVEGSTNVCTGVTGVSGGPGGTGGFGGHYVKSGTSWTTLAQRSDGQAGSALTAAGGDTVFPGTDGAPGANGNNGASASKGTVNASGWVPGDGTVGVNGAPGQGGGGGGGRAFPEKNAAGNGDYYGWAGSGGGAGGCPGMAGGGGKGGGASIGLVSWNSGVKMAAMSVTVASGGDGGAGDFGSAPQPGGAQSPANGAVNAHSGAGGAGGHSGWSGHGAGGSAIGVAYKGTPPDLGGAVPTVGSAGKGHAQSVFNEGGYVKTIPAAADGVSAPVWPIP